ncbi:hypothetical protein BTVI_109575 [Pitangus sulphuratus]|nr:hypothetical protein BTVI_109575 [Pitangus sulphuratus]
MQEQAIPKCGKSKRQGTRTACLNRDLFLEVRDDGPRGSQYPELEDHDCMLSVGSVIVQDLLLQLQVYRVMQSVTKRKNLHRGVFLIGLGNPERSQADWMLMNIVSVFKKSKKEEYENSRLVSLPSVTRKVMEKIILRSIENHLKDNSVVTDHSH